MKVLAGVLSAEIAERPLLGRLHELFDSAGAQLYLVGGSVRDLLLREAGFKNVVLSLGEGSDGREAPESSRDGW